MTSQGGWKLVPPQASAESSGVWPATADENPRNATRPIAGASAATTGQMTRPVGGQRGPVPHPARASHRRFPGKRQHQEHALDPAQGGEQAGHGSDRPQPLAGRQDGPHRGGQEE